MTVQELKCMINNEADPVKQHRILKKYTWSSTWKENDNYNEANDIQKKQKLMKGRNSTRTVGC